MTLCSLLDIYRRFEETFGFYFQERKLTFVQNIDVFSGNRKCKQFLNFLKTMNLPFDVENKIKRGLIRNVAVYQLVFNLRFVMSLFGIHYLFMLSGAVNTIFSKRRANCGLTHIGQSKRSEGLFT